MDEILNQYFRNLVGCAKEIARTMWVEQSLATKLSSFVVAYGVNALIPTNLALEGIHSMLDFNQDGEDMAKKHEQILEMNMLLVENAQECYDEQINAGGRKTEYEVGQKVLLNVNNWMLPKGLNPKFMSKIGAMFSIVK